MRILSDCVKICMEVAIDGRRLALFGGKEPSRYIETHWESWKGGIAMSIMDLIAVLSFGLTCFGAGYALGKDHSTKK